MTETTACLKVIPVGSGVLRFVQPIASAWVHVDGKLTGAMDQAIEVRPGRHSVQVVGVFGLRSPEIDFDSRAGDHVYVHARTTAIFNVCIVWIILATAVAGKVVSVLYREGAPPAYYWWALTLLPVAWVLAILVALLFRSSAYSLVVWPTGHSFGFLVVTAEGEPMTAPIYIDGRRVGRMGEQIAVPTGSHVLQVRGWIHRSRHDRRTISSGQTATVRCATTFVTYWVIILVGLFTAVGCGLALLYESTMGAIVVGAIGFGIGVWTLTCLETVAFVAEGLETGLQTERDDRDIRRFVNPWRRRKVHKPRNVRSPHDQSVGH